MKIKIMIFCVTCGRDIKMTVTERFCDDIKHCLFCGSKDLQINKTIQ